MDSFLDSGLFHYRTPSIPCKFRFRSSAPGFPSNESSPTQKGVPSDGERGSIAGAMEEQAFEEYISSRKERWPFTSFSSNGLERFMREGTL